MDLDLPILAGTISTIMFGCSTLPMVLKAARTRDLHSYSLGNILLANGGNLVHSLYVFNMPPGPLWALHTFYLVITALMLFWYLRFEKGITVSAAALRFRLKYPPSGMLAPLEGGDR